MPSSPFTFCVALLWTHSNIFISCLCMESKPAHSARSEATLMLHTIGHFFRPVSYAVPNAPVWPAGHTVDSYWVFHQAKSPDPFPHGCSPASCPPVYRFIQDCPMPGTESNICSCWTWVSYINFCSKHFGIFNSFEKWFFSSHLNVDRLILKRC